MPPTKRVLWNVRNEPLKSCSPNSSLSLQAGAQGLSKNSALLMCPTFPSSTALPNGAKIHKKPFLQPCMCFAKIMQIYTTEFVSELYFLS